MLELQFGEVGTDDLPDRLMVGCELCDAVQMAYERVAVGAAQAVEGEGRRGLFPEKFAGGVVFVHLGRRGNTHEVGAGRRLADHAERTMRARFLAVGVTGVHFEARAHREGTIGREVTRRGQFYDLAGRVDGHHHRTVILDREAQYAAAHFVCGLEDELGFAAREGYAPDASVGPPQIVGRLDDAVDVATALPGCDFRARGVKQIGASVAGAEKRAGQFAHERPCGVGACAPDVFLALAEGIERLGEIGRNAVTAADGNGARVGQAQLNAHLAEAFQIGGGGEAVGGHLPGAGLVHAGRQPRRARQLVRAAVGEEPGQKGFVVEGGRPAVVSAGGILDVANGGVEAAQGVDHVARAHGRDGAVGVAVGHEDRQVSDAGRLAGIATAADGHGRREEIGPTADGVPRAVAAHGDARHVHARGIHVLLADGLLQELERKAHHLGGRCGKIMRAGRPVDLHPAAVLFALRGEQANGFVALREEVEDRPHAVNELCLVVCATFAGAMEKEHQRGGPRDGRRCGAAVEQHFARQVREGARCGGGEKSLGDRGGRSCSGKTKDGQQQGRAGVFHAGYYTP